MAFVDQMPPGGWKALDRYCRQQAELYNPQVCDPVSKEKARSGRELIVMLPNDFADRYNPSSVANYVAAAFRKKHGVPCAVAIHWNKKKSNYHAHIVFSERELERTPPSVATRNTYFDVAGKRSTKKECTDELGRLLPGCRFVAKGENLSDGAMFGAKKGFFGRGWLVQEKQRLTAFFNEYSGERWQVYSKERDYHIPTIHVGKDRPAGLMAWAERENERIQAYNEAIDELLEAGEINYGQALNMKFKVLRERKAEREQRMAERARWKEARALEFESLRRERAREREYYWELSQRGALAMVVELGLILAGCKVDDFTNSWSRWQPDIYGGLVKISLDTDLQRKIDDMYIAMGKTPPSKTVLRAQEPQKRSFDAIIERAETVRQAQQTSSWRDPFDRDREP